MTELLRDLELMFGDDAKRIAAFLANWRDFEGRQIALAKPATRKE